MKVIDVKPEKPVKLIGIITKYVGKQREKKGTRSIISFVHTREAQKDF